MRYATLAILLVIAASIGAIVGAMLIRPSGITLAVTTQQREDQITLFAEMRSQEPLKCSGCSPQDWSFFC